MSAKGFFLAGLHVPDLDRVLLASRDQAPAVRAECQGHSREGNPCAEAAARLLLLAQTGRVPEFYYPVAARRSQVPAIAAEHHPLDLLVVSAQCDNLPAGLRAPDLHGPVRSRRDQVLAVRAERHGVGFHAGRELEAYPAGPGVPDFDDKQLPLVLPTGRGDPLPVGVPGHTEHDSSVAGELDFYPAGPRVPDFHWCVESEPRRSNPLTVGADRHSPDLTCSLAKAECFLSFVTLQGCRIPDADGPVQAARGQAQAVWAEHHAPGQLGVSAQVEDFPARCGLPNAHRLIFADRGEARAVGAEGDTEDQSVVCPEGVEELAGRSVPQDEAPVEAGRDEAPTVRAKRQCADGVVMFGEDAEALAGRRVPDHHDSTPAPRREAPSVWAERHTDPFLRVSWEGEEELVFLPVPNFHGPVTSRGEVPSVGAERHAIRRATVVIGVARAAEHLIAGRQVPNLHLPVRARAGQVLAISVEHHTKDRISVRVEGLDLLARPAVPDLDGPIAARGGDPFTARAECQAADLGRVPEDDWLDPAQPLQIVPFPLPQLRGTLVELFQRPAELVPRQLAVSQGDTMEVRFATLAPEGLQQVIVCSGLGFQSLLRRPLPACDQHRARCQHGHCH